VIASEADIVPIRTSDLNPPRPMDRGFWITWYDLPDDGREDYLSWLHETYIPALLKRPGFLWAAHYAAVRKESRPATQRESALNHTDDSSVPTGSRYILLIGAERANVFADPVPSVLHAGLPAESRKMLAMRIGERVNVMVEAARIEGPQAKQYQAGMALAPCIQLGSFNCPYQHEEEMLAWYAQWRMPKMRTTPGCIRTRKLASVSGWAKHAVLYEFTSLEARNQHFIAHEDRDPEMKAWSDRMVQKLVHAPGSSTLACRSWPAVSN
jgi:ribosome modulation factor